MSDEKYHFIGLGGIGMSALARVLLAQGKHVQGSDLRSSLLLEELEKEGALVRIGHKAEALGPASVAVYSSDVPIDNVELVRAKELKLQILHRSELLHALMQKKKPLLVTGTHGKTTVTALLASVLDAGGLEPSFVVGGIHRQWNTNGRSRCGEFFVAEADESDHSFVKTPAFGAIVTNLENDHLNYWKTPKCLGAAFQVFFEQSISSEHVFWCGDDERLRKISPKGISYGFGEENQLRIVDFKPTEKGVRFSVEWGSRRYENIDLCLFGRHNALNGAAVFGLALRLGVSESLIRNAFASFAGTCRRLEWKAKVHGVDLYDDYGHHPTEISVTLKALRDKIRERRLVVVFQPHRFTRVQDLFDEFLTCFAEADVIIMTDIYSAGEPPIAGVSSAALYAKLREKIGDRVHFSPRSRLEIDVAEILRPYDVVLTLGAGDVTKAGDLILRLYEKKGFKWTVGVAFGGTSSEHAVSLMSAKTVIEGLKSSFLNVQLFGLTKNGQWLTDLCALNVLEAKVTQLSSEEMMSPEVLGALTKCDVVIPVFHGQQGEDGMIQGLLDTLNIPYVGSDYRSSALCMHKGWTKHVARAYGVPTPSYIEFDSATYRREPALLAQRIDEELQYPLWIKPVHLGSSVAVFRVMDPKDLGPAAEAIFSLDDTLIAEVEIDGREVEFSLLGNEYIRVAPPGEIMKVDRFHGYDNKYGATASPIEIPARLSPTQRQIGEELALEMYRRSGCKGLARIDFFLDKEGHFWFNEINPLPGFTATSAYPAMWKVGGLDTRALCDELLILAFHKHRCLHTIRGK
jgi:UDP-N-acetylmuramate--alanine ligase